MQSIKTLRGGGPSTISHPPPSAYPDLTTGSDWKSVYVHSIANQKRELIAQPQHHPKKDADGKEIVHHEFLFNEFTWWNNYIKDTLPCTYETLLKELDCWVSNTELELLGFNCYQHKHRSSKNRCNVEALYLPLIKCGKYHPYASVKHRRRASMRLLDRLKHLEKVSPFDYLIKIDLTLPKEISLMWKDDKLDKKIRESVRLFLNLLHAALFPDYDSQFGVISNHHYWATKSPLEPHRHIHLTIPNVCFNREDGKFHRFNPYIDEKLVKAFWKIALMCFGVLEEATDIKLDCWLGQIKFKDIDKVLHRLSYCSRKPTEDLVEFLTPKDLDNFDEDFARFLLDYTPRVINLGFLTNLKKHGYYNSNKSNSFLCPICGEEMECIDAGIDFIEGLDRPPPPCANLVRDRKGDWYVLSQS